MNTLPTAARLSVALLLLPVLAKAQTGIGTFSPDPTVALDVVAAPGRNANGPLRLRGLNAGSSETRVLVADGLGILRYRPAAELFPPPPATPELWQSNAATISPRGDRPVGIGTTDQLGGSILSVDGDQMLRGQSRLQFRSDGNYIYSSSNDDRLFFVGRRYVSFRNSADDAHVLTVQAETERVGIGEADPAVDFEVNGTQRMTGSRPLEFGSDENRVYRRNENDWRFVGRTLVNFMDRDDDAEVMTVNARSGRVGIKETEPAVDFEVNGTQRMTGSRPLEFGNGDNRIYRRDEDDWRFAGRGQVNFMNRNNDAKVMTVDAADGRVGIRTDAPERDLHVNGTMRLTGDVGTADLDDDDVLLAGGNGDIRRAAVAALVAAAGDDLGDHRATENVQLRGHWLSNDGGDEGLRVTDDGRVGVGTTAAGIDRLRVGGHSRQTGQFAHIYGDDNDLFVRRNDEPASEDVLQVVNNRGSIHFNADTLRIRNTGSNPVATFRGDTRRVGLGTEDDPDATLHIRAANNDAPLEIDGLELTPNNGNGNFRILVVDDDGVVYRSRRTTNGSPNFGGGGGGRENLYRGDTDELAGADASGVSAAKRITAENARLRRELMAFREELDALTREVGRLRALHRIGEVRPAPNAAPAASASEAGARVSLVGER